MQLMTFNSLLMFDIVFVFFLFLVGVTCLVYYLPPARTTSNGGHNNSNSSSVNSGGSSSNNITGCRHHGHHHHYTPVSLRLHRDCGHTSRTKTNNNCNSSTIEFFTPKHIAVTTVISSDDDDIEKGAASNSTSSLSSVPTKCFYVKAKPSDVKKCSGPIQDV